MWQCLRADGTLQIHLQHWGYSGTEISQKISCRYQILWYLQGKWVTGNCTLITNPRGFFKPHRCAIIQPCWKVKTIVHQLINPIAFKRMFVCVCYSATFTFWSSIWMLPPAINSTVGRLFTCLSDFQILTLQFPLFLKCCLRECVCSQEPVFSSTGKEGHGVTDKRNMNLLFCQSEMFQKTFQFNKFCFEFILET